MYPTIRALKSKQDITLRKSVPVLIPRNRTYQPLPSQYWTDTALPVAIVETAGNSGISALMGDTFVPFIPLSDCFGSQVAAQWTMLARNVQPIIQTWFKNQRPKEPIPCKLAGGLQESDLSHKWTPTVIDGPVRTVFLDDVTGLAERMHVHVNSNPFVRAFCVQTYQTTAPSLYLFLEDIDHTIQHVYEYPLDFEEETMVSRMFRDQIG